MQKGKSMQYAMAGVQLQPGIRMNVRSHVRVPDGEVGYEGESMRQPYYAQGPEQPVSRRSATIPAHIGVIFLVAVFVLFGGLVLNKYLAKSALTKDISAMEESIVASINKNTQLQLDVEKARDSARISYMALQMLGMVDSGGMTAVPVEAPDTRPGQYASSLSANSPLTDGHGSISGSR